MHEELSQGGKRNHADHVKSLKRQLRNYGVDPFDKCPPKCLPTGVEIDKTVVRDMLNAPATGNVVQDLRQRDLKATSMTFLFQSRK